MFKKSTVRFGKQVGGYFRLKMNLPYNPATALNEDLIFYRNLYMDAHNGFTHNSKKKKKETTHVVLQWVNGFTDRGTSIPWNRSTTEQLKRSKILTHIITWIKFKKIILHEKNLKGIHTA